MPDERCLPMSIGNRSGSRKFTALIFLFLEELFILDFFKYNRVFCLPCFLR